MYFKGHTNGRRECGVRLLSYFACGSTDNGSLVPFCFNKFMCCFGAEELTGAPVLAKMKTGLRGKVILGTPIKLREDHVDKVRLTQLVACAG